MKSSMPFLANSKKTKKSTPSANPKNFLTPILTFTQSWPTKLVSLSLGIAGLLNTSCKDNKKLGLEKHLIDNPAGVYLVDSLKVNVQTVRIDNPSTKNQYRFIVGEFVDPFMGKLKA